MACHTLALDRLQISWSSYWIRRSNDIFEIELHVFSLPYSSPPVSPALPGNSSSSSCVVSAPAEHSPVVLFLCAAARRDKNPLV